MKEAPYVRYKLKMEKVPRVVLFSVQTAEEAAYARTSRIRYIVESILDILAFLSPKFIFKRNYSVGSYRLKSKSAQLAIRWAVRNKKLIIYDKNYRDFTENLPQFIVSPRYGEDIARLVLEKLRCSHPLLKKIRWVDIAKDDYLIAKIYSGYMGAGGDMREWRKNLQPGKVARKRLRCKNGKCAVVDFVRKQLA